MSKTVKHCGVCQENFGDRFSFCPVCGEPLKAVEPGQNEAFAAATVRDSAKVQPEQVVVTPAPLNVAGAQHFTPKAAENQNGANGFHASRIEVERVNNAESRAESSSTSTTPANDGLYHLTILEAPKSYGKYLSTGAMIGLFLMMTGIIGVYIYDVFNYNLDVAAVVEEPILGAAITNEEPPVQEEEPLPKTKDKDTGGGGGGGGKEDPKPASKGVDAPQTPEPPIFPPSAKTPRLENPSLPINQTTQGPIKTAREEGPYGIKSSTSLDPSDGPGRGGGQGNGTGQGQGNGIGTGIGNGIGSGRGNGRGNGIGNGTGDGTGLGEPPPAPVKAAAVTEKLKIISKPRPGYTDEARKNNISGTVVVKVTFSASGQVSNVAVVKGLPYGLTEKALAAARQISFTPQKQNGVPVSVAKSVEFNFTLY